MKKVIIRHKNVFDAATAQEIGTVIERNEKSLKVKLINATNEVRFAYYGTEVNGQFYHFYRSTWPRMLSDIIGGNDGKKALEKVGFYLDI